MNKHISVLLDESLNLLDVKEDGIYVDGTLGRGGHTQEIAKRASKGKVYTFDLDEEAIKETKERLKDFNNIVYIHDNFMNMNQYINEVDGIMLDLGVSSPQFDEGDRGFSYRFDAPLDMRMNLDSSLTASYVVNNYSKEELENIFFKYGEEKNTKRIVSKILEARAVKPIETTLELVEIIKSALPAKILSKKGHPAKQCFQALRIEVNKELDSLETFLERFQGMLKIDGKVVIITFHSLEDRLVKQKFKSLSTVVDDKRIMKLPNEIEEADYELINHKAIIPSDEEIANNPRSKSAKVRGIRRVK